jgi:hypothetical protein
MYFQSPCLIVLVLALGIVHVTAQITCVDQCESSCSFEHTITSGDTEAHAQWTACFHGCISGPSCASPPDDGNSTYVAPARQQPAPPPERELVTDDGLPLIRCAPGYNPFLVTEPGGRSADSYPKVICLTSTPVLYGHRLSSIEGSEIWVVSELAWFIAATRNPPR